MVKRRLNSKNHRDRHVLFKRFPLIFTLSNQELEQTFFGPGFFVCGDHFFKDLSNGICHVRTSRGSTFDNLFLFFHGKKNFDYFKIVLNYAYLLGTPSENI